MTPTNEQLNRKQTGTLGQYKAVGQCTQQRQDPEDEWFDQIHRLGRQLAEAEP